MGPSGSNIMFRMDSGIGMVTFVGKEWRDSVEVFGALLYANSAMGSSKSQ